MPSDPIFTTSYDFAIYDSNLYARDPKATVRGHTVDPKEKVRLSTPGSSTRTDYYRVKSKQKYFKDCLETAEDLITDTYPATISGKVRSKVKYTNEKFGDTNEKNIAAAQNYKTRHPDDADANAKPAFGEAYVIVSLDSGTEYPYHAAAVIATDGADRVTLEVFASDQHATARTEDGDYHIYTVPPATDKTTFHDTWRDNPYLHRAGKPAPTTIIIQKK
jgi:hypothetical protein